MGSDEVILLDTHVLVWAASAPDKLTQTIRTQIAEALQRDEVAVSAITFWEIALLTAKSRLHSDSSAIDLRRQFMTGGGIELPLTGEIAIQAVALADLHGDPADRFIVATALAHNAILYSADQAVLSWKGQLQRRNAAG